MPCLRGRSFDWDPFRDWPGMWSRSRFHGERLLVPQKLSLQWISVGRLSVERGVLARSSVWRLPSCRGCILRPQMLGTFGQLHESHGTCWCNSKDIRGESNINRIEMPRDHALPSSPTGPASRRVAKGHVATARSPPGARRPRQGPRGAGRGEGAARVPAARAREPFARRARVPTRTRSATASRQRMFTHRRFPRNTVCPLCSVRSFSAAALGKGSLQSSTGVT